MKETGELEMDSMAKVNQFREERNWRQFHNEKDLAISISLEASELLELFQWKQPEEVIETSLERIKEELADVLIYSYMMADNLNLDLDEIIEEKLQKNKVKYPVEVSYGQRKKYTELHEQDLSCKEEEK
jgi:NTP pyrophosphatase (non-canonical NTP hydrolase)